MPGTIKASEQNVEKIFCNDYLFEIPVFQRPYAWTTDEVDELLDDLLFAMRRDDNEAYFLRGCLKMGKAGQSAQGEAGHCDVNPSFGGFTQRFVVLAQPSLQVQPTKGAFHDPPPRQHLKSMLLWWTPHQLQGPAAHRPGPLYQFAAVGPISPDQL